MFDPPAAELFGPGARVETRYAHRSCARIEIHSEDGLHAAHAAAALVRRAILDAAATGARTAELTLDVSSPVSGFVLSELRDILRHGIADVRLRPAGATILADIRLVDDPASAGRGAGTLAPVLVGATR